MFRRGKLVLTSDFFVCVEGRGLVHIINKAFIVCWYVDTRTMESDYFFVCMGRRGGG